MKVTNVFKVFKWVMSLKKCWKGHLVERVNLIIINKIKKTVGLKCMKLQK